MTWIDTMAALPEADRLAVIADLRQNSPATVAELAYDWSAWRRPAQVPPPGNWRYWLVLGGRGMGKTRIGAEWVREKASSGDYRYVNIAAATADTLRDICIMGESGILDICPPHERPRYISSQTRLEWPNGCRSLLFSADEPERLRGKQHQALWCDELGSWRKEGGAWTMAKFGLRLPPNPQAVLTTTPKPLQILRSLISNPATTITHGSTYENRGNLDPTFFSEIITEFEGQYLGRQELDGVMLEEAEGALWRRSWIDKARVEKAPETLHRIAVGVDPPGGKTECGIVAAASGDNDQSYILADASEKLSAAQWGAKVWRVALLVGADLIAVEKNFGGDMVEETLRAAAQLREFEGEQLPPVQFVTASRGKAIRAEPHSARTQQGRVHHVGCFDDLEDELCTWEPGGPSPNRLDAMVWSLAALELPVEASFMVYV